MWHTESRVTIAVPVEDVYDYLSDLRRHSEWSLAVADIEQTQGTGIEVGAEFVAHETVPMKFTSFSRITRLDPLSRIEWTAWDNRTFRVDWAFELAPDAGGTLVVQTARIQPASMLGRVLLRLMRRRQIPRENARSLQRLKEVVEAGVAPAAASAAASAH